MWFLSMMPRRLRNKGTFRYSWMSMCYKCRCFVNIKWCFARPLFKASVFTVVQKMHFVHPRSLMKIFHEGKLNFDQDPPFPFPLVQLQVLWFLLFGGDTSYIQLQIGAQSSEPAWSVPLSEVKKCVISYIKHIKKSLVHLIWWISSSSTSNTIKLIH